MTQNLVDLPFDVLELIFDRAEDEYADSFGKIGNIYIPSGLMSLSCSCAALRAQLAPRLFSTVHFTNNRASAESALLAVKKYGRHTKSLAFAGLERNRFEVRRRSPRWHDKDDNILCAAGRELLLGRYTPNACMLDVCWAFHYGDPESEFRDTAYDPAIVFEPVETLETVRFEEGTRAWRTLMKTVWASVSQNQVVRHLNFALIPPVLCSQFFADDFKAFMGRLDRLTLIFSQQIDYNWAACNSEGIRSFFARMDDCLLAHAQNLSSIALISPLDGLLGDIVTMPLLSVRFPKLETLKLAFVCINMDLVKFLSAHRATLKKVTFLSCWSCSNEQSTTWDVEWADVFKALSGSGSVLEHFECLPDGPECYTASDEFFETDDDEEEWNEVFDAFQENQGIDLIAPKASPLEGVIHADKTN